LINRIVYEAIMPEDGARRSRGAAGLHLPAPEEMARMRARAMSQKEMARALRVDPGQLSRWEAGKGEMSYAKIRRYAHVLNLRLAAADPTAYLVERIANRRRMPELRLSDPMDRAVEAMAVFELGELPVLSARGDEYVGVLRDSAILEALAESELRSALDRPVGSLRFEPLDRIRPGDSLHKVAALLASQNLVLVEDRDGLPAGFATRKDLFPLLLGGSPGPAAQGRRRSQSRGFPAFRGKE
jgi:predicted transcriptional regulator